MKRKLRRSLYCIVCVLTLLSVSCIAAFADVPMKSIGIAPEHTDFVTGPSILVGQECDVSWSGVTDTFLVNNTIQAYLPSDDSYGMEGYDSISSSIFYQSGSNPRDAEVYSEVFYDGFNNEELIVDPNGYVYGSVSTNFRLSSYIDRDSDWSNYMTFTVRDFYCWPESQTDDGLSYPSEVRFDLYDSIDYLSFVSSRVYYSLNGSDEILEAHFSFDDVSIFEELNFKLPPDILPGVGPTDVVYVYLWDVTLYDSSVGSPSYDGPHFEGFLVYTFNPDVRKIDLNSARGFDSGNPAVPLLDYTAWIGTAVSGFLDLQIFPYFTLGGVLMTLLAFTCVIWFLKLVAGG